MTIARDSVDALDPRVGARVRTANRAQLTWGVIDLEGLLPADHPARAIWAMVERLDLSALYAQIAARDQTAGAPAIDPKILLCLWIYATSDGEGSAREIARRCEMHTAYRWICGGVSVRSPRRRSGAARRTPHRARRRPTPRRGS